MLKKRCFVATCFALLAFNAYAVDDTTGVSYSVCEKIAADESLSSARNRAADKAAFHALEILPAIAAFRDKVAAGAFNTKIYELADNYLQNYRLIANRNQNGDICVTVNADVSLAKIKSAFAAPVTSSEAQPLTADENNINLPPKPDITINHSIAYQENDAVAKVAPTPQTNMPPSRPLAVVLVERTEFFDGTSTDKFYPYLRDDLMQLKGLEVTNTPDNPDYVLKTKVLKAKVDSLNAQTSRLHIVVSLTLTDTKTNQSQTEHQNRFILFENSDDAQSTAAGLIRKLFTGGVNKLLPAIKNSLPAGKEMITPNS